MILPKVGPSTFSNYKTNVHAPDEPESTAKEFKKEDELLELTPEQIRNKDWYRDDIKEFRISPANGVRTMVFTIEPKPEVPVPVVYARAKEKKRTKAGITAGDQEMVLESSKSPKRRISNLHFIERSETHKEPADAEREAINKTEGGKRRSILSSLVSLSNDKIKSLHEIEDSAELKKKTEPSLVFDSQTNIDSRMKKSMYRSQQTAAPLHRKRNLEVKPIDRVNLFEGLPYVPYDAFLRRDPIMQNLITRDVLKILVDKCNNLRVTLLDKGKIIEIFNQLKLFQKQNLNRKLEETTVILYKISNLILQEFQNKTKKLGILIPKIFLEDMKSSAEKKEIADEVETAKTNISEYMEVFEYFRDSVDCYFIIARQRDRRGLDDRNCTELLKLIGKCRYNTGEILEEIRVHEVIINEKFRWIDNPEGKRASQQYQQGYLDRKSQTSNAQHFNMSGVDLVNEEKARKFKAIQNLLQNKFNFARSKTVTRESKVVLNQDKFENEKNLLMKSNNKKYRQQMMDTRADNRIKIKLERLQNPFKVPEIREALKVMKKFPNYAFDDDVEDLM